MTADSDQVQNGLVNVPRTFTLGGTNTNANEMQAVLKDNSSTSTTRLTKDDVGKWIISGDNIYTGPTDVNAGTLLINGNQSSATGDVTVKTSAVLGGIGTVGGAVTVNGGGTMAPGTSGVGTLTVNDNVTMEEGARYDWEYDLGTGDRIDVVGNLTLPEEATVTISEITAPLPETSTIFTATSIVGSPAAWTIEGLPGYVAEIQNTTNVVLLYRNPSGTVITIR